MLLYGGEAWNLLSTDVAALRVFERKVLCKIFGSVLVGNDFRIRYNSKLYELLNDLDVVQHINIERLSWLAGIYGSRRIGRPCIRWNDQTEEGLSSISVINLHRRTSSRGAWKDVLRQAETC